MRSLIKNGASEKVNQIFTWLEQMPTIFNAKITVTQRVNDFVFRATRYSLDGNRIGFCTIRMSFADDDVKEERYFDQVGFTMGNSICP